MVGAPGPGYHLHKQTVNISGYGWFKCVTSNLMGIKKEIAESHRRSALNLEHMRTHTLAPKDFPYTRLIATEFILEGTNTSISVPELKQSACSPTENPKG